MVCERSQPLFGQALSNVAPPGAVLSLILLVAWLPMLGLGQEGPKTAPAKQPQENEVTVSLVRQVLRQLESDKLVQRDAAEKRLVELGPAVVVFLPAVDARTSGELKIRLQRIRQALQTTDVKSFFEASKVTLAGKMKLSKAVQEITMQTGNEIELQGEDALTGVEVELDCQDELFWTAMDSLMSQANLRINAFGTTEGNLVLAAGGEPKSASAPGAQTNGPFRIDVASVRSTLPFAYGMSGQLDISLQVTWEPRMKPIFMQIPMSKVEAILAGDKKLAATNPQAAPEIPLNYGGCSTQVDLQLQRPDRSIVSIEKLAGEFLVAVPSERHKYVFEKFGNGARQSEKYGDVSVTLEGARRNGAVYEMRVLVEIGNSQGALDSFRGWILSNEAYLLDSKESKMENVGLQTYAITPNAVGIAYLFQINGDPNDFKLVYESPGMITTQSVQYELIGIELP